MWVHFRSDPVAPTGPSRPKDVTFHQTDPARRYVRSVIKLKWSVCDVRQSTLVSSALGYRGGNPYCALYGFSEILWGAAFVGPNFETCSYTLLMFYHAEK